MKNKSTKKSVLVARETKNAQEKPTRIAALNDHQNLSVDHKRNVLRESLPRTNQGRLAQRAALGAQEDLELLEEFIKLKTDKATPMAASHSVPKMISENGELLDDFKDTEVNSAEMLQRTIERANAMKKKESRKTKKHSTPREEKVLNKWRQQNRQWERFKENMAKKLNKDQGDLVMSRAADYREQMEEYELIQKAIPFHQKHGGQSWLMSLRSEGIRYVPVGNLFSGLFCPVKIFQDKPGDVVRRPLNNQNSNQQTWKGSKTMNKRKEELKSNLQKLRPHSITPDLSSALKVSCKDLLEWAVESSKAYYDFVDQTEIQRQRENEQHLEHTYASGKNVEKCNFGPQLKVLASNAPNSNVSNEGGIPRILFCTTAPTRDVGECPYQSVVLTISNTGTVALRCTWLRAPTMRSFKANMTNSPSCFALRNTETTLLPHENAQFEFIFSSRMQGTFMENWELRTFPRIGENDIALTVELKGHTGSAYGASLRRIQAIASKIESSIKYRSVNNSNVNSLPQADDVYVTNWLHCAARKEFECLNSKINLYYTPKNFDTLKALHHETQQLEAAENKDGPSDTEDLNTDNADTKDAVNADLTPWNNDVSELRHRIEGLKVRTELENAAVSSIINAEEEDEEDDFSMTEAYQQTNRRQHEHFYRGGKTLLERFMTVYYDSLLSPSHFDFGYDCMFSSLQDALGELPISSYIHRDKVGFKEVLSMDNEEQHNDFLEDATAPDRSEYLRLMENDGCRSLSQAVSDAIQQYAKGENMLHRNRRIQMKMDIAKIPNIPNDSEEFAHLFHEKRVLIHFNLVKKADQFDDNDIISLGDAILAFTNCAWCSPQYTIFAVEVTVCQLTENSFDKLQAVKARLNPTMVENLVFCQSIAEVLRAVKNLPSGSMSVGIMYIFSQADIEKMSIDGDGNKELADTSVGTDSPDSEAVPENALSIESLNGYFDCYVMNAIESQVSDDISNLTCPQKVFGDDAYRAIQNFVPIFGIDESPTKSNILAVVGGNALSKKLQQIDNLLNVATTIYFTGLVGATFKQYLKRHSMGSSQVEYSTMKAARRLLGKANKRNVRICFACDHVAGNKEVALHPATTKEVNASDAAKEGSEDEEEDENSLDDGFPYTMYDGEYKVFDDCDIPYGWYSYDMGPKSVESFTELLSSADSVIVTGLPGAVHYREFQSGALAILEALTYMQQKNSLKVLTAGTCTVPWLRRLGHQVVIDDEQQFLDQVSLLGEWPKQIIAGESISRIAEFVNDL